VTVLSRPIAIAAAVLLAWLGVAAEMPSRARLPLEAVVLGARVTQRFGCTAVQLEPPDPQCPLHHFHTGIDLAAPAGTEIHSATDGVVSMGYDSRGAGNFVAVALDGRTRILYCHLSAFRVRPGDAVVPGQVIGLVGATGLATGPHVHLEVQVGGRPVDPAAWLAA